MFLLIPYDFIYRERRKQHIPAAEAIIEDFKMEFNTWMNGRKHAPTIHALKAKLNDIVENELTYQRKKLPNFDEEQAELISARIIQKITNHCWASKDILSYL
jgi:glutamyl-tRNA reductase